MRLWSVGVWAILALIPTTEVWAGHPQMRRGFWIGFGAGYGGARVGCEGCDTPDREGSYTAYLKLGGTLSDSLLLGLETNVWRGDVGGFERVVGNVSGTLTFYPEPTMGIFMKAGFGGSILRTTFQGRSAITEERNGLGWLLGLGGDIRVGANVSLTPGLNFYNGRSGDPVFDGHLVLGGRWQSVLEVVVGLTFH